MAGWTLTRWLAILGACLGVLNAAFGIYAWRHGVRRKLKVLLQPWEGRGDRGLRIYAINKGCTVTVDSVLLRWRNTDEKTVPVRVWETLPRIERGERFEAYFESADLSIHNLRAPATAQAVVVIVDGKRFRSKKLRWE